MLRHQPPTATPLLLPRLGELGDAPAAFRTALEAYFGSPCFPAASGRTALYVLLHTLSQKFPHRTDVLMPAYTCPVLAKVTLDAGLRPLFIDISPKTFTFNQTQLSEALSEKCLAVIVVHPFGIPQDVAPVMQQAKAVGALVIEDAAQAMGARWEGELVGRQGDFGLFSLGPGKALSTGGGGFLCVNRPDFVEPIEDAWRQLQKLSPVMNGVAGVRYGVLTAVFTPPLWWVATRLGIQRAGNHEAGWGYRKRGLTAVQAAIGLTGLARLDAINEARRENGHQLASCLQSVPGLQLVDVPEAAEAIYLRFPLISQSPEQSDALFNAVQSAHVGAGRLYRRTLPQLFPQHETYPTPGAAHIARCLTTLPTHHFMQSADIERICRIAGSMNEPGSNYPTK